MRLPPAACLAALLMLAACTPAPCKLPGQRPMQMIELYFGSAMPNGKTVAEADWADFAARDLTPAFPAGFTIFDTQGQWLNPATGRITREPSRVVRVAVPSALDLAARIEAVSAAYRVRFHQASVGITSAPACAAF